MNHFLFLMVNGLSIGFLYALLGLGFVVIYKSTGVLNFAQGSMVMIGGYFWFFTLSQLELHPLICLPLVALASIGMAIVIEVLVLRPLIGKPILSLVMITIGLTNVIEGIVLIFWGSEERTFPETLPNISVVTESLFIQSVYIWAIVISILLIAVLFCFFKFSNLGIVMRAVSNNQSGALSMGINISKIFRVSWVLSALIATAGGYVLSNVSLLNPSLSIVIYPLFAVVIIGGLDSIPGALVGGLVIGVLQTLVAGYLVEYAGTSFKTVFPFLILLLVLMVKPHGLFGTKTVERL